MIYLFWTVLNGIIFFYFLYLIFGFIAIGKRIFRPQFKIVSITIMFIGIIQIISASNKEEKNNMIVINEKINGNYNSMSKTIKLEDNLTMDIVLLIKYTADGDSFMPTASHSVLTGFVGSYIWEFNSIQTSNLNPNEQAEYSVNGILKWNLFGINVYSESKSFSGIIK
ncbi:hypothetical protein [Winogradskyella damuponensis]|uniref:Uncharacterized protein n=2 Tax=Flavobacteriaceae TaxID=49546 RepID=A0ABP8CQH0_9FLAO